MKLGLQPDTASAVFEFSEFPDQFKILHRAEGLQFGPASSSDQAAELALYGARLQYLRNLHNARISQHASREFGKGDRS